MLLSENYFCVEVWIWIILIMCLIILIIGMMCQFFSPDIDKFIKEKKIEMIDMNEIMNEIEDGDVMLFTGNTFGEKNCKWFTGNIFSHVGFLFRERNPESREDIVYIFECDLGQRRRDGVRIMELKDKLDKYIGYRTGALKKLVVSDSKKRPSYQDIMKLVEKYEGIKFDGKFMTWFTAGYYGLYNLFKDQKKMFCSELVASMYQDLGIIKKDRLASWYSPGNFHLNDLNFEDGYSLGKTYFFNFPKSETKK